MADDLSSLKLHLIGCGKMGSALLKGWLSNGLLPQNVWITDPYPSDWVNSLTDQGCHVNQGLTADVDILILATKPQMMPDVLSQLTHLGNGACLVISIAAGTAIESFEKAFGAQTPIIRVMPNTPAAIGAGISGVVGNQQVSQDQMALALRLMAAVGDAVQVAEEKDIHSITAVSGSGPAYVFALAEALEAAAIAKDLPPETARQLAISTIYGAAALMKQGDQPPADLRVAVTSPNGTTQAGLAVLQDSETGLDPLIDKTVSAAYARSLVLSKDG